MSTTSLMTFAELEQLPDAPGKRALIDGELIELPPPIFRHSEIAKRFATCLQRRATSPASFRKPDIVSQKVGYSQTSASFGRTSDPVAITSPVVR